MNQALDANESDVRVLAHTCASVCHPSSYFLLLFFVILCYVTHFG